MKKIDKLKNTGLIGCMNHTGITSTNYKNVYMEMNWIRVDEKKPPQGTYVLVAVYDSRPKVHMYFRHIAERINENYFCACDGETVLGKCRQVTHWMPIPDSPNIDENNK